MKQWWASLQPRERLFVGGGAALLAVFLLGWLGLRPLFAHARAVEQRVQDKSVLLADLRTVAAELAGSPGAAAVAPVSAGESLVVIVDRTTREAGLASSLKRNQPVGENGIRVRFEDASFDHIVTWMGVLHTRFGIEIESAAFEALEQQGRVQASLTLERTGS